MGTFLIILIIFCLLWPWLSRFLSGLAQRYMRHRAEDFMRRMMGMPSRKEEKRRSRESGRTSGAASGGKGRKRRRRNGSPSERPSEILSSVATDVEYTEIREFQSTRIAEGREGATRVVTEEQVSDVEYIEIKEKRK